MTTPRLAPSTRAHLAVYGLFLLLAILVTWPLVTVMGTHFAGYPFGDAHEMARHIWWFKYALQHGQPLIFQPLLAYPDGMEGVILWSNPLQFFPAWLLAFVMPLPAAYNVQALLNLALSGWAAYFLMWKLSDGQRAPAIITGVAFMAAPTMQGHLAGGHGGLLVQWPLPLLAYSLMRLRTGGVQHSANGLKAELRRLLPAILCFILLPLGHTLQLIYAGLPLIAVFGLTLLVRREWRAFGRQALVVVVGGAILAAFLSPVLRETVDTAAYTEEGGGVAFSIDLLGIVTPSFNHPVYGRLDYTRRVLGVNIVEGSSYIGIVAGVLALVAVWKVRAARWWLLLGVVAGVLALGPLLKVFDTPASLQTPEFSSYIPLPWALVADLPGFNLARTPGRFGFVAALAVSILAGYGAAWISQRLPDNNKLSTPERSRWFSLNPRPLALYPILLLIVFDYQSFWPLPTYSAAIPAAVYELAERNNVRAVFNLPWDNVLAAKDALWLQTAHEKPLIAGQVTRRTPVSPAKLTILAQTLDLALLDEAGADVVILHRQYDDGTKSSILRSKLGAPLYEDDRLALWDVPESDATPPLSIVMPSGRPLVGGVTLYEDALQTGNSRADMYVYTPEPGWLRMAMAVTNAVPPVNFQVDGQTVHQRTLSPFSDNLILPLREPGYHTIAAATDPPCPIHDEGIWSCGFGRFSSMSVSAFVPASFGSPVIFDRGLTLEGSYLFQPQQGVLWTTLWWRFDQARSDQDIRFVKVLDESGNQVAGEDKTLGEHAASSQQVETITLLLNNVPAGTYRVCAGWYTYPDLTRFPVQSDIDGAQDGLACIGEFTIPETRE